MKRIDWILFLKFRCFPRISIENFNSLICILFFFLVINYLYELKFLESDINQKIPQCFLFFRQRRLFGSYRTVCLRGSMRYWRSLIAAYSLLYQDIVQCFLKLPLAKEFRGAKCKKVKLRERSLAFYLSAVQFTALLHCIINTTLLHPYVTYQYGTGK